MTKDAKILLAMALVPIVAIMALVVIDPFAQAPSFERDTFGPMLGWTGLLALMITMAYGYRKWVARQGVGPLYVWKIIHCIAGYLFLILLFTHTGGQMGIELQFVISSVSVGIILIGVWGLLMQGLYPKWMTQTLVDSVYKDELKDDANRVLREISKGIEGKSDNFNEVYQKHILYAVTIDQPTIRIYTDMKERLLGQASTHSHAAADDLGTLTREEKDAFLQVAQTALALMEIRLNQSYQRRINGWLVWHSGLSILLLMALFLHIVASFYY